MTEFEILLSDPVALREREQRLSTCWHAALDLLSHCDEDHNKALARELLEFLSDEYEETRAQLLAMFGKKDS